MTRKIKCRNWLRLPNTQPAALLTRKRHRPRSKITQKQSTTSTHLNLRFINSSSRSTTTKMHTIRESTSKPDAVFQTSTLYLASTAPSVARERPWQRIRTQTLWSASSWPQLQMMKIATLSTFRTCALMPPWIRIKFKWNHTIDPWYTMGRTNSNRTLDKMPDILRDLWTILYSV